MIHPDDPLDRHGRGLRQLRISVTDRCNLRCSYCMPEESYEWLPRGDLLSFEEIVRVARVFQQLGVRGVRLTGGEPLLRRDLEVLVRGLAALQDLNDLSMTTNAILLAEHAGSLREAGLHRVTVSLDTLRRERFSELARQPALEKTLEGIAVASECFPEGLKLNMVVMRGVNDDEMIDMLEFGKRHGAQVRFIEYMDVGGATRWTLDQVVSRAEILAVVGDRYGSVEALPRDDGAPAARHVLPDGTVFGVISSTTVPFCGSCERSRITADGIWYRCLYEAEGVDLRRRLRDGAGDEALGAELARLWGVRDARGAEERLGLDTRGALYRPDELRAHPHREMHTRGG